MDAQRAVYIKPDQPVGGSGSGYLIGPRLVLTALHVVHNDGVRAAGATVWVGHPRTATGVHRRSATVIWPLSDADPNSPGVPDVALLQLDQEADAGLTTAVRWGRPRGSTPLAYSGIGIPAFSAITGGAVQYENLRGELAPLTTAGRRWVLDCGVWPAAAQQKEHPWAGASGAIIFTDGHLVGVAVEYGTGMGERRLTAEPVHRLLDDPGFAAALAEHGFPGTRPTADDITAPTGGTAAVAVWPHQVGVIPRQADCFQHRGAAEELQEAMADGGAAAPNQVLVGTGGIGKTQLAAHHARQCWAKSAVDLVVWVTSTTREAIIGAYAQAAVEILDADPARPEQAAQAFLAWLEPKQIGDKGSRSPRWLIVLDDLADPADLSGLWPPTSPSGSTLITTRRQDASLTGPGRRLIQVGLFTPQESTTYLTTTLVAHGRHEPAEQLAALADELGHLPLALSQAAAYLIDARLDCVTYRTRLADRTRTLADVLPDSSGLPDDQATTVAAAWSLSIERVDTMRPVGLARPMLQLAAMLDPNGIPHTVLTGSPVLAYLTEHSAQTLDADRTQVTAEAAEGVLQALRRLSLIDHAPDIPHQAVRVHQLIQRAVRDRMPADQRDRLARTAADALLAAWPAIHRDTGLTQALRANTDALTQRAGDSLYRQGIHDILFLAGNSLGNMGRASAAMNHFAQVTEQARDRLGPDHPDTLAVRNDLSAWVGYAEHESTAVRLFTDLVADMNRVLGPTHAKTLIARNNLVHWLGQAGDVAGASAAAIKLLSLQHQTLGPEHPDTLTTRNNLAALLGYSGDAAEAAIIFAQLIPVRERVLGPDHPHTLTTRHNFAHWQGKAGDAAGAMATLAELLPLRERVLGPDHPDTLVTRADMAIWQGRAGDESGAATALAGLLPDLMRVLGLDHPYTLATRDSLAFGRGIAVDAAETADEPDAAREP
ncbi:tetratricopeptide repeat protein [Streptomyces pseudogriseolus]|uniref:tetratricopeptide repeat protein n=1 Tax=Streptomyces pseudogriseolus TaxID=36817 RepID=UPI003FA1A73E